MSPKVQEGTFRARLERHDLKILPEEHRGCQRSFVALDEENPGIGGDKWGVGLTLARRY